AQAWSAAHGRWRPRAAPSPSRSLDSAWRPLPDGRSRRRSGCVLLTLARGVEGGDRDLEHVVGWFAGRELLRPQHGQQRNLDHGVAPVAGDEADELEAGARDDRDRDAAAGDEPEPVGVED